MLFRFPGMALIVAGVSVAGLALAQSWPNLDTLQNYPTPGESCGLEGDPSASPDKQEENRHKNRYKLPPNFKSMTVKQMIQIPVGPNGGPVPPSDPRQDQGVSLVGYVREVGPGGTKGESCNCGATGTDQVDTHIEVGLVPTEQDPQGKGKIIVETTERVRRLAKLGLLTSNFGSGTVTKNWSLSTLRALKGRWVKFDGWLFYDSDHQTGAWNTDPKNKKGETNWRATCWEVHPVMGITVLPGPPQ